jgi:hypothetical protein
MRNGASVIASPDGSEPRPSGSGIVGETMTEAIDRL